MLGGVIQRGNVSSSSDGSDCVETGFYTVANNSNFPGSNYGTLIVFTDAAASHAAIVQEYITNGAGIYMRRRSGTSDSWIAWSRIDNFGCNTAADLASLLGGISKNQNNAEGLASQRTFWGGQTTSLSVNMEKKTQGQNFLVFVGQYQYDSILGLLGFFLVSLSPARFSEQGANIIELKDKSNIISLINWSDDTLTVEFSSSNYYVISLIHV